MEEILGYPDDLKFHSSMTLFAKAGGRRRACFEGRWRSTLVGRSGSGNLRAGQIILMDARFQAGHSMLGFEKTCKMMSTFSYRYFCDFCE